MVLIPTTVSSIIKIKFLRWYKYTAKMFPLLSTIRHFIPFFYELFFGYIFKEPTVNDALRVLHRDKEEGSNTREIACQQCEKRIGTVTFVNEHFGVVNHQLYFDRLFMSDFEVGMRVEYCMFKENGDWKLHNVEPPSKPETESDEDSQFKRKLICQVTKRDGRKVFAEPYNIKFHLNSVYSTFVPLVGDWLEIVCMVQVDEQLSNLAGQIHTIEKVAPLLRTTITGEIREYSERSGAGQIAEDITFQQMNCSPGYVPMIGDIVTAEVIESDYKHCVWRALKVCPSESLSRYTASIKDVHKFDLTDIYFGNRNPIQVSKPTKIEIEKLGEERHFSINITNNNKTCCKILGIQMVISECQVSLLRPRNSATVCIDSAETYTLQFKCEAKFMGATKELIIIRFERMKIGRWIYISVGSKEKHININRMRNNQKNLVMAAHKFILNCDKDLVAGRRLVQPPAFITNKLPLYDVPEKMAKLIFDEMSQEQSDGSIESVATCLVDDLTPKSYKDKFHMLLYMEELGEQVHVQKYNIERASFSRKDSYFVLEVPNLNERRPSIILGDKLIAKSSNDPKYQFEGYVHKTGAHQLYLQFNYQFHASYQGEDLFIEFCINRTNYRRCHHAINLAFESLSPGILFPEKVTVKDSQVKFLEVISKGPNGIKDLHFQSHKVLRWKNRSLNKFQKSAVRNILIGAARPLPYLLFGPPGTGKTVTLVEAILQLNALVSHSRILVVGPSNAATDLMALRLLDSGVLLPGDLVRMVAYRCVVDKTIPERLIPYCVTGDIAREGSRAPREHMQNGVRMCVPASVIGKHRIIVSTCAIVGTLYTMGFKPGNFTHIIMDEAGQISEPEAMIPLSLFNMQKSQVILAGDPLQLGPCVFCALSRKYGLAQSYFERLINSAPYQRDIIGFPETSGYNPHVITRLVYNYRSLPEVLELPNQLFYNGELIPKVSDKHGMEVNMLKKLAHILPQRTNSNGLPPAVVFHGVRGENTQSNDSPSWYNSREAYQVIYYLQEFYHAGLTSKDIGIITPYTKQCAFIRGLIHEADVPLPKIGSVEEYQGQEFNVVILSTVRSNETEGHSDSTFGLGFVASSRRLNVAISRARALLIIVGNPHLLLSDHYWRSVIQYAAKNNGYRGCDLPDF